MKGILWTITIIILTMIFLIFLVSSAFQAISQTVKADVILNTEQVVGIINMLQSSPSETSHIYYLPKVECKLKIESAVGLSIINMTIKSSAEIWRVVDIIQTPLNIMPVEIDCDKRSEKKIYLKRCDDELKIELNPVVC